MSGLSYFNLTPLSSRGTWTFPRHGKVFMLWQSIGNPVCQLLVNSLVTSGLQRMPTEMAGVRMTSSGPRRCWRSCSTCQSPRWRCPALLKTMFWTATRSWSARGATVMTVTPVTVRRRPSRIYCPPCLWRKDPRWWSFLTLQATLSIDRQDYSHFLQHSTQN